MGQARVVAYVRVRVRLAAWGDWRSGACEAALGPLGGEGFRLVVLGRAGLGLLWGSGLSWLAMWALG